MSGILALDSRPTRATVLTTNGDEPSVFVVDDDLSVRTSTAALISFTGLRCEAFASGEEFLANFVPFRPGCAVFDLRMPGMGGLELQERVAALDDALGVILVSGFADVATTVRAMRHGALAVLEKPYDSGDLLAMVRDGLEVNRTRRAARLAREALWARYRTLDPRECQAMSLIVQGLPNKAIARQLAVSQRTVDRIRADILHKMHVESAVELAQVAYEIERSSASAAS